MPPPRSRRRHAAHADCWRARCCSPRCRCLSAGRRRSGSRLLARSLRHAFRPPRGRLRAAVRRRRAARCRPSASKGEARRGARSPRSSTLPRQPGALAQRARRLRAARRRTGDPRRRRGQDRPRRVAADAAGGRRSGGGGRRGPRRLLQHAAQAQPRRFCSRSKPRSARRASRRRCSRSSRRSTSAASASGRASGSRCASCLCAERASGGLRGDGRERARRGLRECDDEPADARRNLPNRCCEATSAAATRSAPAGGDDRSARRRPAVAPRLLRAEQRLKRLGDRLALHAACPGRSRSGPRRGSRLPFASARAVLAHDLVRDHERLAAEARDARAHLAAVACCAGARNWHSADTSGIARCSARMRFGP